MGRKCEPQWKMKITFTPQTVSRSRAAWYATFGPNSTAAVRGWTRTTHNRDRLATARLVDGFTVRFKGKTRNKNSEMLQTYNRRRKCFLLKRFCWSSSNHLHFMFMTCISYQEGMVVELRESTSDGIDVLQTSRYLQPCVSQPKQVFLTKNGFWLLGWVITLGLWFRMINFFLLSLDVCLLQVRIFSLCVANCWSTFATIIYNLNNKRSCLYLQTTPSKCEWPIPGYAWNCLTCQDLKRWSCDPVQGHEIC